MLPISRYLIPLTDLSQFDMLLHAVPARGGSDAIRSIETPRVHHAHWRGGGVAGHGARLSHSLSHSLSHMTCGVHMTYGSAEQDARHLVGTAIEIAAELGVEPIIVVEAKCPLIEVHRSSTLRRGNHRS